MASGIELITVERERQLNVEGWMPDHDDEHGMGELIAASITYAGHALEMVSDGDIEADAESFWPWKINLGNDVVENEDYKPSPDPIRDLVKAGALLAAEIDRLQRAQENTHA